MDMAEELDFEIRLDTLPVSKGVRLATKIERAHIVQLGDFLIRLSEDRDGCGVSFLLRNDGQITLEMLYKVG